MLKTLSVSQRTSFQECQRKWWYERHFGAAPPTPQMKFGTQVHEELEGFFKLDTSRDELSLPARSLLRALEDVDIPLDSIISEGDILIEGYTCLPIRGVIDARVPSSVILDFKVTSAPANYKVADSLQLYTYTMAYPDTQEIGYVFWDKRKAAARVDIAAVDPDQLEKTMVGWFDIAPVMQAAFDTPVRELPPAHEHPSNCFFYGRPCPIRKMCLALLRDPEYDGMSMPESVPMSFRRPK